MPKTTLSKKMPFVSTYALAKLRLGATPGFSRFIGMKHLGTMPESITSLEQIKENMQRVYEEAPKTLAAICKDENFFIDAKNGVNNLIKITNENITKKIETINKNIEPNLQEPIANAPEIADKLPKYKEQLGEVKEQIKNVKNIVLKIEDLQYKHDKAIEETITNREKNLPQSIEEKEAFDNKQKKQYEEISKPINQETQKTLEEVRAITPIIEEKETKEVKEKEIIKPQPTVEPQAETPKAKEGG